MTKDKSRVQHDNQMSTDTDPELISPDRSETSGHLLTKKVSCYPKHIFPSMIFLPKAKKTSINGLKRKGLVVAPPPSDRIADEYHMESFRFKFTLHSTCYIFSFYTTIIYPFHLTPKNLQ